LGSLYGEMYNLSTLLSSNVHNAKCCAP
jgi:hypothetical protein